MTISTIDLINAELNGQDLSVLTTQAVMVNATKPRKEKPIKAPVFMTREQLAERERIREQLQTGTSIVEFTKVDGTKSIMECTLDPALLPPADPTATSTRPEQNHLLHVYAVDRQGWRSFLVNNVTRIYRP